MKEQPDSQRSKCYAWEQKTFPNDYVEQLTLDECKAFAEIMYGSRVKVKDGRGTRRALAYHNRYPTIGLPKWARNLRVIAHEVAHLKLRGKDYPAHGATFMRIMLELLQEHCDMDYDQLKTSAVEYGLKVAA